MFQHVLVQIVANMPRDAHTFSDIPGEVLRVWGYWLECKDRKVVGQWCWLCQRTVNNREKQHRSSELPPPCKTTVMSVCQEENLVTWFLSCKRGLLSHETINFTSWQVRKRASQNPEVGNNDNNNNNISHDNNNNNNNNDYSNSENNHDNNNNGK